MPGRFVKLNDIVLFLRVFLLDAFGGPVSVLGDLFFLLPDNAGLMKLLRIGLNLPIVHAYQLVAQDPVTIRSYGCQVHIVWEDFGRVKHVTDLILALIH